MAELYLYEDQKRARVVVTIPLPIAMRDPDNGLKGRTTQRTFYATQYEGDYAAALTAAREYRDETAAQYWGEDWVLYRGRGRRAPKRKINESSKSLQFEPGVRLTRGAWTATWSSWTTGVKVTKSRSFSVAVHGEKAAYDKALKARREGMDSVLLAPMLPLPELAESLVRTTGDTPSWEVRWRGQRIESFNDDEYARLDDSPTSWWSFIEALARLKQEELKMCGHTQVPERGQRLKKLFEKLQRN